MSLSEIEAVTESEHVPEEPGNLRGEAWRRLRRDPVALVGFGLIAAFVLVAVFAPLIAPYSPTDLPGRGEVTPTNIPGPSAEHWFGLDQLGHDEFSRVVYGARQSLLVGVVSLLLVVGSGGSSSESAGWSPWTPTEDGVEGAKQIADHVGPQYRLPTGEQLVLVDGGELKVRLDARDVLDEGTAYLTVFNPQPGGGVSRAAEIQVDPRPDPVDAAAARGPNGAGD
jgi:hypothetical protein